MPPICLTYLNNRYHDPTTGTFLSVDPLVNKTGDPYLYAAGNPTTLSDPTGLCTTYQGGGKPYDDGKGPCGGGGSNGGGAGGSDGGGAGDIADAIWLTASEINSNTSDQATQDIRDVREPTWTRGGMWLATLGVGWLVDLGQSGDALVRFAWRFKTGGEWDIKQDLGNQWYETTWNGTTWQIRNDVFGNIHYGAVLDAAGLTATEATSLAGLGESTVVCGTGSGGFDYQPLKPIIGANSAVDDFATELGYEIDVGTLSETATSINLVLINNIAQLYALSLSTDDRAVKCIAGCG